MATLSKFSLMVFSSLLASLVCPTCSATFITYHCSNVTQTKYPAADSGAGTTFQSSHISAAAAPGSHNSETGGLGAGEIRSSFHCRRGIPPRACRRCVEAAAKDISNLCRGHQNGIVWNTDCTVRYVSSRESTDITLSAEEEETPWAWWHSHSRNEEIVDPARFSEALAIVAESLIDKATSHSGRSAQFCATGEVMVTILDTLYAVVECSPGGSPAGCRRCLQVATARAAACCGGSRAAEVLLPSCRLGYDLGPSLSWAKVGPFTSSSSAMGARSIANSIKK